MEALNQHNTTLKHHVLILCHILRQEVDFNGFILFFLLDLDLTGVSDVDCGGQVSSLPSLAH